MHSRCRHLLIESMADIPGVILFDVNAVAERDFPKSKWDALVIVSNSTAHLTGNLAAIKEALETVQKVSRSDLNIAVIPCYFTHLLTPHVLLLYVGG